MPDECRMRGIMLSVGHNEGPQRSRLLSWDKDSPDSRSIQSVGRIIVSSEVGGLYVA
jgi:hypothetical protein